MLVGERMLTEGWAGLKPAPTERVLSVVWRGRATNRDAPTGEGLVERLNVTGDHEGR